MSRKEKLSGTVENEEGTAETAKEKCPVSIDAGHFSVWYFYGDLIHLPLDSKNSDIYTFCETLTFACKYKNRGLSWRCV